MEKCSVAPHLCHYFSRMGSHAPGCNKRSSTYPLIACDVTDKIGSTSSRPSVQYRPAGCNNMYTMARSAHRE